MALTRAQRIIRFVGANVRRLREERGWSQDDLGKKTDSSRRTIQDLELGDGNPGLKLLVAVATALEVDPAELFRPAPFERRDAGRPPSEE